MEDWLIEIGPFEWHNRLLSSSVSLNNENICREISEDKIAVYEKTTGLQSGNFSDLTQCVRKC
jgi:hypothetical protein